MHYTSRLACGVVPNQPSTPNRNFRYGQDRWDQLEAIASDLGLKSTSALVRLACDRLIRAYTSPEGLDAVTRYLELERDQDDPS